MRRLQIFIFFVLALPLAGQQAHTGISAFYVPEKNSLNIGFTSFDLANRLLSREHIHLDYGMRFIGATAGKRGGYFAFGYFSELIVRHEKKVQAGINLAFLAGGGAAAPDYDGWMAQGTIFAQYNCANGFALRTGLNYAWVSRGVISGFSPLVGLSWRLRTGNSTDSLSRALLAWHSVYAEAGTGAINNNRLGFIGVGAAFNYGRYLRGDVMIHAITNAYGGYMQSLLSPGPDFSIEDFHIVPAIIIGCGGGGGAKTKGGALYGAQLGVFYRGGDFNAGLKYQLVEAVSKQFGYNGIFLSLGKNISGNGSAIPWSFVAKAYAGNGGFGNIGARFTALKYRKLSLMGSTYWAFTHERGAYAEGLFEAALHVPRLPLYLISSFGAGAGSGINNRTSSLIYSAGAGIESPFKHFPLSLEVAYWAGGNIPHGSVALCYRVGDK